MRCFFGIELSKAQKDGFKLVLNELSLMGGLKPVDIDNLHITLNFLGEIPDGVCREIMAEIQSTSFDEFTIESVGVGVFPSTINPKIIWAGLGFGADKVKEIKKEIDALLGSVSKSKLYHPHITLARVKQYPDDNLLNSFIRKYSSFSFGVSNISRFCLFSSVLTPSGPKYGVLKGYNLRIQNL